MKTAIKTMMREGKVVVVVEEEEICSTCEDCH